MKNLKYYVVDTLLNEVSEGFKYFREADNYVCDILEALPFAYREKNRYLIIPKWS
jgi:hypothetical protein